MSEMYYNGAQILPCPRITSFQKENKTSESGKVIGTEYSITISGTLISDAGFTDMMAKKAAFSDLWSCPSGTWEVKCDGNLLMRACIAAIESVTFSQTSNNWAITVDYTINLRADAVSPMVNCNQMYNLKSVSDQWTIQEDPECFYFNLTGEEVLPKTFSITRNISASAYDACDTGLTVDGWVNAKTWVDDNIAFDTGLFYEAIGSGCITGYNLYNEVRLNTVNKCAGSYSVSQSWVLREATINTGIGPVANRVKEQYTINVEANSQDLAQTVSLDGSIEGLEEVVYTDGCKQVTTSKYQNATEYWGLVKTRLHERAQNLSGLTLGISPDANTFFVNPKLGQVRYSYLYNDRTNCITVPTGCTIKRENISLSYSNPSDIYPEIQVLGRPCPILQDLGIKSKGTKTLNADMVVDCGPFCQPSPSFFSPPFKSSVQTLVDGCYSELTGTYGTVAVDSDQESWNPKSGSYTRTVTWSYADCCDSTNTGSLSSQADITILGGVFTPIFYQRANIVSSTTGDQILLPLAGDQIGKRLEVYNLTPLTLPVNINGADSFNLPVDTSIETGTGFTGVVSALNTWTLIPGVV